MKCSLLFLVTMAFNSYSVQAGTVFSWLDDNGVMHFTDKKPAETEVKSDQLTTKTVEVTNILESEKPQDLSGNEDSIKKSEKNIPQKRPKFETNNPNSTQPSNGKVNPNISALNLNLIFHKVYFS